MPGGRPEGERLRPRARPARNRRDGIRPRSGSADKGY